MSRVSAVKMSKQASLNLGDMVDKRRIDLSEEEVKDFMKDFPLVENVEPNDPNMVWGEKSEKPLLLDTTIDQIKALFNVGKEVVGWSVSYYAPPKFHTVNKVSRPVHNELKINPVKTGLAGRFIVVVGTREVPTLQVAVGSSGAESKSMMFSGDCVFLKITVCPILATIFSNDSSEIMPARKGFRENVIKKSLKNRHIFVFDAHVDMTTLATKVKDEFAHLVTEKKTTGSDIDLVADLAAIKSIDENMPTLESVDKSNTEIDSITKRQNSELSGENMD
jgi:hypothetical protein